MDKAYILAEIRRTAEGNGGQPLGWRRLEAEAGIRYEDWYGVYWARWNDAVREAGLTPNQFVKAYDPGELLDRLASLTLELGRLPTEGDLRLKSKNDKSFPNSKTIARIGGKAELVQRLAEFCRNKPEYAQVLGLCGEYVERPSKVDQTKDDATQLSLGFVYLMKSGRHYKIGKTNSAGRREYELAIQLPERAKSIHVIRTDDPSGIEAYWHKRFESKRMNGEWFSLNAEDVAAFKRRKFM